MSYRNRHPPSSPHPAAPGRDDRRRRLVAAVVVCVIGVLLLGGSADMLTYSVGLSGTRGHLRVDACEVVGSGRGQHTDCHGTYRSDDGRVTDEDAVMAHHYPAGADVAVERSAGGTYYPIGFGAASGDLAGICFGVMLLAVCGSVFVQSSRRCPPRVPGRRIRTAELPPPLGAWLRGLGLLTLGALGLFAVFFVTAVISGM